MENFEIKDIKDIDELNELSRQLLELKIINKLTNCNLNFDIEHIKKLSDTELCFLNYETTFVSS